MSTCHTIYTIGPSPDSTVAIEIRKTGLVNRKYFLVFERYAGELVYDSDEPLTSTVKLNIQAESVVCRDRALKAKQQRIATRFALGEALKATIHPEIHFASHRFQPKPLRGFVAEGALKLRGVERNVKANVGFGNPKNGRIQIDADARITLADFGIKPPSSFMGLIRTEGEVFLQVLVWGRPA